MAWRFVRQPDGKLARFSDVVDSFTHCDLSESEAYEIARDKLGADDARAKVKRALDDDHPEFPGKHGDGLVRWREAIDQMRSVHGFEVARETLAAMGFDSDGQRLAAAVAPIKEQP